MLQQIFKNRLFVVLFHMVLGVLFTVPFVSKIYAIVFLLLGIFVIYKNENENEEAVLMSSYLVGLEVFLRMTKGAISYEIGKYGVAFFLVLGLVYGKKIRYTSPSFIVYILLLFIGISLTSVPEGESIRKAIVFNLSGPILLGICAIYMYKRDVSYITILQLLFLTSLPLISMIVYLFVRTPDLKEFIFNTQASFYASGGFGPNQVSTVLGWAILSCIILIIQKVKISEIRVLDFVIIVYLIYRGLMTFSRGGMITAFIVLMNFLFFWILYKKVEIKEFLKYTIITVLVSTGIWVYTTNMTGGMIYNRYSGKNARGVQKKDITSGRTAIFELQLENFYDNPILGIGVGNGKYRRGKINEKLGIASHNEVSRLLEEHGVIGGIMILLLLFEPLAHSFFKDNFQRSFLLSFFLVWFLTINHSGMRIALPSFVYGLSLVNITKYEKE